MPPRLTLNDLATLTALAIGGHDEQEGAACVMEYHTVRRGLPWSDEPADVSPVIRAFVVRLHDTDAPEGADVRSRLLEMERAGRFDDTAADAAVELMRGYVAADWAVRECAPLWLRAAGLREWADRLAGLAPITDPATAAAARAAAAAAYWDAAAEVAAEVAARAAAAVANAAARAAAAAANAAEVVAWAAADVADVARAAAAAAYWDAARAAADVETRRASFDSAFVCLERMLAIRDA